ncbi:MULTISPECIES: hypothetical protein [unclassified Rathayibacter]|uniref:hypothetical protein n=1 Tax=unclassified Rathayibacter TaxID=2609250 RepID=UPI00188A260B|nr:MULTISPECIES: hypothetical protein [unclassified Rathayibacter]MBF4462088.1 hypothetical protein [Rathayibacter sp. VKM Ac-2879]MBF4503869.1 hypothetical protein [Rathayibacter sp. VKM Ac-2878]
MDRIELAASLHALARETLSDAVTRAVNRGELRVSPLPVRSVMHEVVRRSGGRRRSSDDIVETAGVNAWSLDDSTAVALARGGLLLRNPADGVFSAPSVAELADARDEQTLADYLSRSEELIAKVLNGRTDSGPRRSVER